MSRRAAPHLPLFSVLLAMVGLAACQPAVTAGQGSPRTAGAPPERESPEPPHRVHSHADDLGAVRPPDRLSIPSIGGGTPSGVFFVGVILAVALIPFFAFREVGRVIGERELHSLMFTDGAKAAFQSGMRQEGR